MTDKEKPAEAGAGDGGGAATAESQAGGSETFRLDIESFLTPVPGDNPAGEALRYEGTYDRIQEARKEEPSELP